MKKFAKVLALSLALVMCAALLTACASADNTAKKYEDAGYTVSKTTKGAAQYGYSDENVEWIIVAIKGSIYTNNTEDALVICFTDAKLAKEAEQTAKNDEDSFVKRSGKVLTIASSEDALNAK